MAVSCLNTTLAGDHAEPFTPEEEAIYFGYQNTELEGYLKNLEPSTQRVFPQQNWNECLDPYIRGNYYEANCSSERGISKILYSLMTRNFKGCIDYAASTVNLKPTEFYIIHKGIYADKRHSPNSLHSEGRAIDIKEIYIKTRWRRGWLLFNFEDQGDGQFYSAFRDCWGDVLYRQNDCPLFEGRRDRTGSLGKEDEDHQRHLHLSVPYCINGTYRGEFFRR